MCSHIERYQYKIYSLHSVTWIYIYYVTSYFRYHCRNEIASVRPHSAVLPRSVRPARCGACFVVFSYKKGLLPSDFNSGFYMIFGRLLTFDKWVWFCCHLLGEKAFWSWPALLKYPKWIIENSENFGWGPSAACTEREIYPTSWFVGNFWNFVLYTLKKPTWPAVEAAGLGWGRLETWLESGHARDFIPSLETMFHWKRGSEVTDYYYY